MARLPTWSKEDFDTLKRLAADGCSGSEIASVLGRSRNSVLGRAHRNGIKLRGDRARRRGPRFEVPEWVPARIHSGFCLVARERGIEAAHQMARYYIAKVGRTA